jgi:hypothetical protein
MDFKNKVYDKILSFIPDGKVRVEAAIRSEKKGKTNTAEIKRSSTLFQPKTLEDWKSAIALATDPENPNFLFLSELYDNLRLDPHFVSVVETRILKVLRSAFVFVNDAGDEVPEVKELFERPWFEEFLRHALWSKFDGVEVIEIFKVDELLELYTAELIPMAHINPKKGLILKEPGDETGFDYRSGVLESYYVQVGKDRDLGMLADLAPMILAKKVAMGSWLDWIEKYGIAPRFITTDNMTTERQDELLEMGINSISNSVVVLTSGEKIEVPNIPNTDSYRVFKEMISLIDSQLSKRVLGQDGTTDHKESNGTYGSLQILQDVANDRHESDKLFAQYLINKELIPRLVKLSSFYAPLANLSFDWDTSEEMEKGALIDKAVALTNAGYILDYEILADKTGLPITGFNSVSTPETEELDEDGKPVKKKSQKPRVKK